MAFDRNKYLARVARMARAGETESLTLPSGEVVTVRHLQPEEFLNRAAFPQALALAAFRRFSAGEAAPDDITNEDILRIAELRCELCTAVLVSPIIVPDEVRPGTDELHYRDLGAEDADALFGWATRRKEAAQHESFRAKPGVSDAGGSGGEVRPAAESDGRDPRPDSRAGV